ncbi:MAG TPA: pyridoxamine 5'-phosphate oxidase family protein [Solirubrobacteraceae bacterium]|nr:pyridoxamine 5'-phosphate oxidase family protein [Solirubrobacteraceae bacterium]
MASWSEVEAAAPELAELARRYFDLNAHKVLATLRRDGSPRVSGTEIQFGDGELWLGSMAGALKARDLQRDPRFALHCGPLDPAAGWTGDAKLGGRAEEITDPKTRAARLGERSGGSHLFRADIDELSVVHLGEPPDHLVIEAWHPGRGVSRRERR